MLEGATGTHPCSCVAAARPAQLPKFLELVGLGYTAWFTYRYLLFKVRARGAAARQRNGQQLGRPAAASPLDFFVLRSLACSTTRCGDQCAEAAAA
jgi:hypothetical protein